LEDGSGTDCFPFPLAIDAAFVGVEDLELGADLETGVEDLEPFFEEEGEDLEEECFEELPPPPPLPPPPRAKEE